jgi:hypothetical protein
MQLLHCTVLYWTVRMPVVQRLALNSAIHWIVIFSSIQKIAVTYTGTIEMNIT